MRTRLSVAAIPAFCGGLLVGGGCGRDTPSASEQSTVHIGEVTFEPDVFRCAGNPSLPYEFKFTVNMVNTTAVDVDVTGVSSDGRYVAGGGGAAGGTALVNASLPFTPLKLDARFGEGATVVTMGGTCPAPAQYGDISVTLKVHTTAGTLTAPAVRVSIQN